MRKLSRHEIENAISLYRGAIHLISELQELPDCIFTAEVRESMIKTQMEIRDLAAKKLIRNGIKLRDIV